MKIRIFYDATTRKIVGQASGTGVEWAGCSHKDFDIDTEVPLQLREYESFDALDLEYSKPEGDA